MLIRGRSTRVSQPTGPVEIDWANPLTSGLGFNLCNFLRRDTAGDALITRTANLAQGTTTLGQGLSSAANAAFSAPQNLSGTNVITVAFVFRQANSTGLQVLVEHTANQNTNVGSCLAHTDAGNLEASISNGVGGYNAIRCAAPAVGRTTRIIIQFERIASINKAIRVWYDGVEQATTHTFNGVIGDSFANSTTYFLGRGSSSLFANGVIHDISIWRRYLSDADIGSWTDSPWRVYRPAERRVWLSDVAGGGAATLVIADAAHSQTAESLVLTSATALAIASAAHAQAAENVTLATQSTLVVADASHAHAADSLTLATQSTLVVADATHAHAADNLTLSTGLVVDLTIQDSTHAHTSDTPALAAQSFLQILDASHGHTADSLTLTTLSVLSIADSSHGHGSENLTLGIPVGLTIAEADHGHTADNLTLSTTALTLVASPDYIGRHTARNFSTARHRTRNFSTAT